MYFVTHCPDALTNPLGWGFIGFLLGVLGCAAIAMFLLHSVLHD